MYALMQDGYQIAVYTTLSACQSAANYVQYCVYVGY